MSENTALPGVASSAAPVQPPTLIDLQALAATQVNPAPSQALLASAAPVQSHSLSGLPALSAPQVASAPSQAGLDALLQQFAFLANGPATSPSVASAFATQPLSQLIAPTPMGAAAAPNALLDFLAPSPLPNPLTQALAGAGVGSNVPQFAVAPHVPTVSPQPAATAADILAAAAMGVGSLQGLTNLAGLSAPAPAPAIPDAFAAAYASALGQQLGVAPAIARQIGPQAPPMSTAARIFVGGLPQSCDDSKLHAFFAQYGTLTDAKVMMDKTTGRSRGFGYVSFTDASAVEVVLSKSNKHNLDGKWIEVKRCEGRGSPALAASASASASAAATRPAVPTVDPLQQLLAGLAAGGANDGSSRDMNSILASLGSTSATSPPAGLGNLGSVAAGLGGLSGLHQPGPSSEESAVMGAQLAAAAFGDANDAVGNAAVTELSRALQAGNVRFTPY